MTHGSSQARQQRHDTSRNDITTHQLNNLLQPRQDTLPPPFDVTYVAEGAPLPSWLSYTSSPVRTTVQPYTYATFIDDIPALVTGHVTLTQYETQVIQLPLTVEAAGVQLGFPYTTAGGTGPTRVSVLGATGVFTLPSATASPTVPTPPTTVETETTESQGASPTTPVTSSTETTEVPSETTTRRDTSTSSFPQVSTIGSSGTTFTQTLSMASATSASATASTTGSLSESGSSLATATTLITGGSTSISGGSTFVSDGHTIVVGGSTTVVGGTTLTSSLPSSFLSTSSSPPSSSSSSIVRKPSRHDLTGGQVAGITLGTFAIAVLMILLLAYCCWGRRRRREEDGGYSNRGRQGPDGRPNQWSFVPSSQPVTMAEDGTPADRASGRHGSFFTELFTGRRSRVATRETEPLASHPEGTEEEDDDGGGYIARPDMAERGMTPPRPYRHLAMTGSSPYTNEEPPIPPRTPLKRRPAPSFFAIPRKATPSLSPELQSPHDPDSEDSWKAALGATGALAGVVAAEGGYSDYAQSNPATPPRSTPSTERSAEAGPSGERNPRYYSAVTEMGWLAGQHGRLRGEDDTSSGAGTGTGSGTKSSTGARTASSGPGTGSNSTQSRRGPSPGPPPPPPAPGGGSAGGEDADEGGRNGHSSSGATYDESPNSSQLFYSTPRWARNNQPTEATIQEESPTPSSRFSGAPIREVNEPPLIFSRPSGRRRAPNSPSIYSPSAANDHTPFGALSPTVHTTAYTRPGSESPRARTRPLSGDDNASFVSSTTKGVGLVDRLSGVLAGLAGRKSPTSDVERALAARNSKNDNLTAFSPPPIRARRRDTPTPPLTSPEEDEYDDDDLARVQNPLSPTYSFEAPFTSSSEEDHGDSESIVPELWPRQPLAMGRERRAYVTRSTGTLGQRIGGPDESSSSFDDPMSPGIHSQSSSEQSGPQNVKLGAKGAEHQRHQASDSTTATAASDLDSFSPPTPEHPSSQLAHDPRRNTLGRSPTYASSGSDGSNKFGKPRKGGRNGSSSGGSHSGSSSQHHSAGTSRDGSMGDFDPINSPLVPTLRV